MARLDTECSTVGKGIIKTVTASISFCDVLVLGFCRSGACQDLEIQNDESDIVIQYLNWMTLDWMFIIGLFRVCIWGYNLHESECEASEL